MSGKKKKQRGVVKAEPPISFFNWFVTLVFTFLPGANLLFFIIMIPCARTQTKRNFAIAGLVLSLILLIASSLALFFFSDWIVDRLKGLLETSAT